MLSSPRERPGLHGAPLLLSAVSVFQIPRRCAPKAIRSARSGGEHVRRHPCFCTPPYAPTPTRPPRPQRSPSWGESLCSTSCRREPFLPHGKLPLRVREDTKRRTNRNPVTVTNQVTSYQQQVTIIIRRGGIWSHQPPSVLPL